MKNALFVLKLYVYAYFFMIALRLFVIGKQTLNTKTQTKEKKMAREPKRTLNILVNEEAFLKFKKLCAMNETTMTKVLMDCINNYVAVEMKSWSDKFNTPRKDTK